MRLQMKMSCILEELRTYLDPALLTICTIPYNMMVDQKSREMNDRVRNLNEIIRQIHQRSVFPVRLFDVASRIEHSLPDDASSDCIHFDKPRGMDWLNVVLQRHIKLLESDMLETGQFTFGPTAIPPFFAARPLSDRLGGRTDSRESSRSSRSRQLGATPMEGEEAESPTSQSSVVSTVEVVDNKKTERPGEASKARNLERVKDLGLEDLALSQELAELLGLKNVLHEDLSRHHCVDWLKAHKAHFSRAKALETADLKGIPQKSIMGPVNYKPLKQLGSPCLILEPPKHRTSMARITAAIPAQLRLVGKLLEPKSIGIPDTGYMGPKLAEDPRYGRSCETSQLTKTLAVYDRSDPGAARAIIMAGSDFEGTSPKLFWPKTLVYMLPGAELNQLLALVVAIQSETPCEPELLLFAGMNDHLHAAGLLEHENLSRHHCVDWLKAHEAHFSRAKTLKTAYLKGLLKEIQGAGICRF